MQGHRILALKYLSHLGRYLRPETKRVNFATEGEKISHSLLTGAGRDVCNKNLVVWLLCYIKMGSELKDFFSFKKRNNDED